MATVEAGERDDGLSVRFRMHDGVDLGPWKYKTTASVLQLKEHAVTKWPEDKEAPQPADIKLILAGKILDNNKLLSDVNVPYAPVDGLLTVHLVVRPPASPKVAGEAVGPAEKKFSKCGCTIC